MCRGTLAGGPRGYAEVRRGKHENVLGHVRASRVTRAFQEVSRGRTNTSDSWRRCPHGSMTPGRNCRLGVHSLSSARAANVTSTTEAHWRVGQEHTQRCADVSVKVCPCTCERHASCGQFKRFHEDEYE